MHKTIYDPKYEHMIRYLRQRRRQLGFSQEAVAMKLGVHRTWLCRVEKLDRRLDIIETLDLCRVYKIDPAKLAAMIEERP